MSIRVTVTDTENGDTETQEIENDVIVITAGNRYVDGVQSYANGTQIFTIKVDK
jgi:hypothetical protein